MIVALYADGGVVRKNPSEIGGTYAACLVDEAGNRPACLHGHLTPEQIGLPWVSNNFTEVVAILIGLEAVVAVTDQPIPVYSDSLNAIRIFRDPLPRKMPKWLTPAVWDRIVAVRSRYTPSEFVLLGGHPNRAELAAGVRSDGKPVSEHNVFCDKLCGEEAQKLLSAIAGGAA